jgi:hypothetical protein
VERRNFGSRRLREIAALCRVIALQVAITLRSTVIELLLPTTKGWVGQSAWVGLGVCVQVGMDLGGVGGRVTVVPAEDGSCTHRYTSVKDNSISRRFNNQDLPQPSRTSSTLALGLGGTIIRNLDTRQYIPAGKQASFVGECSGDTDNDKTSWHVT